MRVYNILRPWIVVLLMDEMWTCIWSLFYYEQEESINDVDFIPYLNKIFTYKGLDIAVIFGTLTIDFGEIGIYIFCILFLAKKKKKKWQWWAWESTNIHFTLKKIYIYLCNIGIVRFSWLINGGNKGVCYICGSTDFRE